MADTLDKTGNVNPSFLYGLQTMVTDVKVATKDRKASLTLTFDFPIFKDVQAMANKLVAQLAEQKANSSRRYPIRDLELRWDDLTEPKQVDKPRNDLARSEA